MKEIASGWGDSAYEVESSLELGLVRYGVAFGVDSCGLLAGRALLSLTSHDVSLERLVLINRDDVKVCKWRLLPGCEIVVNKRANIGRVKQTLHCVGADHHCALSIVGS